MANIFNKQPSQTEEAIQLNDKMLELAQELFIEELAHNSLFVCGGSFTNKLVGHYGWYETCNGEVVLFLPKSSLYFTLIYEDFEITADLTTIKAFTSRLNHYDLAIAES